jgi:bifunctional non-homologous end joining protein LigD
VDGIIAPDSTVDVFEDGQALLKETEKQGLEGVVAKRRDSKYECGKRSGAWIKYKHRRRGTFLVCGWMPQTSDARRIGSLLVGELDAEGRLVFRGGVSGFDERARRDAGDIRAGRGVDEPVPGGATAARRALPDAGGARRGQLPRGHRRWSAPASEV